MQKEEEEETGEEEENPKAKSEGSYITSDKSPASSLRGKEETRNDGQSKGKPVLHHSVCLLSLKQGRISEVTIQTFCLRAISQVSGNSAD